MLACAEFGGISRYFCMCHVIGWLEARWKVDVRVECLLPDVEGLDPLGWVHVAYYVHAMDPLCATLYRIPSHCSCSRGMRLSQEGEVLVGGLISHQYGSHWLLIAFPHNQMYIADCSISL